MSAVVGLRTFTQQPQDAASGSYLLWTIEKILRSRCRHMGLNHPGEVFNASYVAEAFKTAFQKAATVENAVHGFDSTGIYPFDANKFTDVDFLPAEVTDQEPPNEAESEDLEDPDNRKIIVFNQQEQQVEGIDVPSDATPSTSSRPDSLVGVDPGEELVIQFPENRTGPITPTMDAAIETPDNDNSQLHFRKTTPEQIIPIPKIQIRTRSGRGLKFVLLTSTSPKEKLENELEEKSTLTAEKEKRLMARKRKLLFPHEKKGKKPKNTVESFSSSESESEDAMSLHNTDSDLDVGSQFSDSEADEAEQEADNPGSCSLLTNDYATVKVHGKTKNSFRLYVARIISLGHGVYECMFFKRYPNTLKFSETPEEAFVDKKDIVLKLSKPNEIQKARFHKMISFPDDLTDFTLY